jgi:hypothetical protein
MLTLLLHQQLIKVSIPQSKLENHKIHKDKIVLARQLHNNLGHASYRIIALAIRHGFIRGTTLTFEDMMAVNAKMDCAACANAKWTQVPRPIGSGIKPDNPFHTVSVDHLGPYNPVAYGNYGHAIIGVDSTTLFGVVNLYKSITAVQYIEFVQKLQLFASRFHFRIKTLRFDAGRVENSTLFRLIFQNTVLNHVLRPQNIRIKILSNAMFVNQK